MLKDPHPLLIETSFTELKLFQILKLIIFLDIEENYNQYFLILVVIQPGAPSWIDWGTLSETYQILFVNGSFGKFQFRKIQNGSDT